MPNNIIFFCILMTAKERESTYSLGTSLHTSTYFEDSPGRKDLDGSRRNSDLPFFSLSTIAAATGNFSDANKLGEGGFGSVFKVPVFRNQWNFISMFLYIQNVQLHNMLSLQIKVAVIFQIS